MPFIIAYFLRKVKYFVINSCYFVVHRLYCFYFIPAVQCTISSALISLYFFIYCIVSVLSLINLFYLFFVAVMVASTAACVITPAPYVVIVARFLHLASTMPCCRATEDVSHKYHTDTVGLFETWHGLCFSLLRPTDHCINIH